MKLAKSIAEEVRIHIGLNRVEPCRHILAARPPGQALTVPNVIVAPEGGGCREPFESRKRLVRPALHTLREARRLSDELLRIVEPALSLIGAAKQEQRFTVTAAKLQRVG